MSGALGQLRLAGERAIAVFGAPLSIFPPKVRQTVVIETTAAAILTGFNCTALPYTGLILRLQLHASADQLAVLAAAGASVMLPSLLWARLVRNRPPLPFVVWLGVAYRGLFVLLLAARSPWPFIAVIAVANALGAISTQAYGTFVQVAYPREFRGQALGVIRVAGALLAVGLFPLTGFLFPRVGFHWMFAAAAVFGIAASLWQRRLAGLSLGRATLHEDPRPRPIAGAVRDDRRFARILTAAFLFGLGIWLQVPLAVDAGRRAPRHHVSSRHRGGRRQSLRVVRGRVLGPQRGPAAQRRGAAHSVHCRHRDAASLPIRLHLEDTVAGAGAVDGRQFCFIRPRHRRQPGRDRRRGRTVGSVHRHLSNARRGARRNRPVRRRVAAPPHRHRIGIRGRRGRDDARRGPRRLRQGSRAYGRGAAAPTGGDAPERGLTADADQPQDDDEAERHTEEPQENQDHDRTSFARGLSARVPRLGRHGRDAPGRPHRFRPVALNRENHRFPGGEPRPDHRADQAEQQRG